MKDYYKILGITDDERKLQGKDFEKVLKPKYRRIALANHPDRMGGKSEEEKKKAEEIFKDAAEAYATLSDEKKRAEYDNPASSFSFDGNFGGMNMDDIFSHFSNDFGGFGFNPFGGFGETQSVRKGSGIRIRANVTLEEIFSGVTKKYKYNCLKSCENCGGTGKIAESEEETCPHCNGTGRHVTMERRMGMTMQSMTICPNCGGTGKIITNPCPHCGGKGVEMTKETCEVNLPPGVFDGMNYVVHGMGNASENGGERGDLLIEINTLPHEKFERNGNDLIFVINVPVLDAITGCNIEVETIDGKKLKTKIPQGTEEGYQLRFNGCGLPVYGANTRGNMIGVVKIKLPKKLSDEEIKLINELKTKENFNG